MTAPHVVDCPGCGLDRARIAHGRRGALLMACACGKVWTASVAVDAAAPAEHGGDVPPKTPPGAADGRFIPQTVGRFPS